MTKQQTYMYLNIPKILSMLEEEEQELLLYILLYNEKKETIAKRLRITAPTLIKRTKALKNKLYNYCIQGYNGEIDDFTFFEKVKEFISFQNKEAND